MTETDLQEIKGYWAKKYPNVLISLYSKNEDGKYQGKILSVNDTVYLSASTIGELISQGEDFLRRLP